MTLLQAGFEVAPSGTTIPDSGGSDAFSGGYTGFRAAFVSDSSIPAAVAAGSYAARVSVGSSAVYSYRQWPWSSPTVHVRQYIYLTASPNARFTWWQADGNYNALSRIRINTDRRIGVAIPSTVWFTAAAIPLDTLVRVEASFDHAAGTMSLAMYVGNSTTAIPGGTVSASGISFPESTARWLYGGVLSTLTNFTILTDAWAVSDTAQPGPLVTGGVVTGVAAPAVIASAPAGSVSAVVGEVVTIAGVTPQVIAQGGVRPIPPTPPSDPLWPPDPYRQAIRSGSYAITYSANASYDGSPVVGAQGLRPVGGTITDTTAPGVRRVLTAEFAPNDGMTSQQLFDLLAPIGTTLTVTCRVTYLNRTYIDIPMGVFDVDSQTLKAGGGGVSLTAPDKYIRVKRARFVGPGVSTPGMLVVDQIALMIRDALGANEPVAVSASSGAVMGPQVWEKDRDKAIEKLAKDIGAWVYFDRDGVATIADIPTIGSSADWLIDASPSGVLVELDRKRDRSSTYNVVMVESSSTDAPFATQVVWDSDPQSPTFAGTAPLSSSHVDTGPFGVVVYYYDTPLPLGNAGALATARTILSRVTGLASQVSLGSAPNPALDAFDVLDVLAPQERRDVPRVLERHVADTVTHQLRLDPGSVQQIEGRSTRTDEFA